MTDAKKNEIISCGGPGMYAAADKARKNVVLPAEQVVNKATGGCGNMDSDFVKERILMGRRILLRAKRFNKSTLSIL